MLVSIQQSKNFGEFNDKMDRKLYIVIMSFSRGKKVESVEDIFSNMSAVGAERNYLMNFEIPEVFVNKYKDDGKDGIFKAFKELAEKQTWDNIHGFDVSVSDVTGGEYTSVKNMSNDHVIQTFGQAWPTDDRDAAVAYVKRNVERQITSGNFKYVDE